MSKSKPRLRIPLTLKQRAKAAASTRAAEARADLARVLGTPIPPEWTVKSAEEDSWIYLRPIGLLTLAVNIERIGHGADFDVACELQDNYRLDGTVRFSVAKKEATKTLFTRAWTEAVDAGVAWASQPDTDDNHRRMLGWWEFSARFSVHARAFASDPPNGGTVAPGAAGLPRWRALTEDGCEEVYTWWVMPKERISAPYRPAAAPTTK